MNDTAALFPRRSPWARWSGLDEEERALLSAALGRFRAIWLWSLVSAWRRILSAWRRILSAWRRVVKRTAAKGRERKSGAVAFEDSPPDRHKKGMRVLFVPSDNFEGSGAFRSMVALARLLRDRHGIDPFVVLPFEGDGTKLLKDAAIPYVHVPSFDWIVPLRTDRRGFDFALDVVRKTKRNHVAISTIVGLVERYAVDLVHVNTSWGYVGALAAKRAGRPFVWHIREFLEEDQGVTMWDRLAGDRLISTANRVVSISRAVFAKYETRVPRSRHAMVYNGIDEAGFFNPGRRILAASPYTFIMVGGFQRYKGHVEFSRACALLYKAGLRNFRVWFVGQGDEAVRNECAEIFREADMDSVVTFWGQRKDPGKFLEQADLAFTCSRFEAFGRVTVEAMMAGCLVIGSKTGGTTELIEDGISGLLFDWDERSVEHIVETVNRALDDPERAREIAAAGTERAIRHFTAEKNAGAIADVYRSVLAEAKAP